MQTTSSSDTSQLQRGVPAPQPLSHEHCAHTHRLTTVADDTFVELLGAYRHSGGLARADEVVMLLERCGLAGVASLARWIVERSVISFEWQQQTWLPWFQFQRAGLLPDPALRAVFAELDTVYDGWEMAHWFARPNSALAGGAPLQRIASDPGAVLEAARADRYVVRG